MRSNHLKDWFFMFSSLTKDNLDFYLHLNTHWSSPKFFKVCSSSFIPHKLLPIILALFGKRFPLFSSVGVFLSLPHCFPLYFFSWFSSIFSCDAKGITLTQALLHYLSQVLVGGLLGGGTYFLRKWTLGDSSLAPVMKIHHRVSTQQCPWRLQLYFHGSSQHDLFSFFYLTKLFFS